MQKKPQKNQEKTPKKQLTRAKGALQDLAPSAKQAKGVKGGASNLNSSKSNIY